MSKVSIIIPVYNEEESVGFLHDRVKKAMKRLSTEYEIVFIDDGSSDGSQAILRRLETVDHHVRIVTLGSNTGQHKALEKGFREAEGDIIVSMDGDLQTDPSDIPRLIAKLKEGFDMVCGWRLPRRDPALKVLMSRIGNYLQKKITGLEVNDMSCTMRAYRRDIVKEICLNHRNEVGLIPYIVSKRTRRIAEVKIKHERRCWGESKYGFLSTAVGVVLCYIRLIYTMNVRECLLWRRG